MTVLMAIATIFVWLVVTKFALKSMSLVFKAINQLFSKLGDKISG